MILRAALLAAIIVTGGCQRGSFGFLEPEFGSGVERGAGSNEGVVRKDGITATVKARWASEGVQTADVNITNGRPTPLMIPICSAQLVNTRLGDAPLSVALDVTDQNYQDERTDNDDPVVYTCYDYDRGSPLPTTLTIPPGETRKLSLSFFNYADDKRQGSGDAAAGDRVTMSLPVGTGNLTMAFTAR